MPAGAGPGGRRPSAGPAFLWLLPTASSCSTPPGNAQGSQHAACSSLRRACQLQRAPTLPAAAGPPTRRRTPAACTCCTFCTPFNSFHLEIAALVAAGACWSAHQARSTLVPPGDDWQSLPCCRGARLQLCAGMRRMLACTGGMHGYQPPDTLWQAWLPKEALPAECCPPPPPLEPAAVRACIAPAASAEDAVLHGIHAAGRPGPPVNLELTPVHKAPPARPARPALLLRAGRGRAAGVKAPGGGPSAAWRAAHRVALGLEGQGTEGGALQCGRQRELGLARAEQHGQQGARMARPCGPWGAPTPAPASWAVSSSQHQ